MKEPRLEEVAQYTAIRRAAKVWSRAFEPIRLMNIDTRAIRRLRDYLLTHPEPVEPADSAGDDRQPIASAMTRRIEPFAETMFLVMMADGDPGKDERRALLGALTVLTEGQISAPQLEALLERFAADAVREGVEARIARLGARLGADRDERETAFTLAAAIALADDHVHAHENHALALIREYYGISDQRMATLLDTFD